MWTSPATRQWAVRQRNDVATTLQLKVFTRRNFAADVFRQRLKFTGKKLAKSRFVPPFGKLRGNVHGSSMACWKARVDFLFVLIKLFSLALTGEAVGADIGQNFGIRKRSGSL